ncbi:xylose isomerase-like protein [Mycobacteroides abscessus subsp. abscessus]|uniref:Xylose isomerase-like TIM barrel domain-containing protein n=2 Tax=Brevibacteriaceae TaxID=85019 RepID=A0ABN0SS32_9MICO|nr:xylose isomerase-like protein [Mycobacteroides abscessus subsp. abscessus]
MEMSKAKKSKSGRKVLTAKNSARSNSRRHREFFAANQVYDHDTHHVSDHPIRIGLSSSSVSPMTVEETFAQASSIGYDGVEIMVTHNAETRDVDLITGLAADTGLDVMSLHAPTLLFLPRVLHKDHWEKLRITANLAREVGATTVVLHPPFRWQGAYAREFVDGVREVSEETGVVLAVENMYPWRAGVREILVYYPDWNPLDEDYDALTFDFSHASTAGMNALDTVAEIFPRLRHVHLTDGAGSLKDEHLVPGAGTMPVAETLQYLAKHNWSGDVVVEVNTRFVAKKSTREQMLADSLAVARKHLGLDGVPGEGSGSAGSGTGAAGAGAPDGGTSHSEPTTPGEASPVETSPEPGTSHRSASSKRASADAS